MKANKRFSATGLGPAWMIIALTFFASAVLPGGPVQPDPAKIQTELFPLSDVRLLEGPLQRQQELNRQYLLRLNPDLLLSWFR